MSGRGLNGREASTFTWGDISAPLTGTWHTSAPRPDVPRTVTPDDVRWKLRYERASVDQFLADTEAERSRLQAEIEVARAQRDAARHVVASRETEAQASLGALVLECEREMAELELSHREVITTIREAAQAEAARVLAAAHREVAAMRDLTVSLAPLVSRRTARPDAPSPAAPLRSTTQDRIGAG